MTKIEFKQVGPLVSVQDAGRFGALGHGAAASGPMDEAAYRLAGELLEKNGNIPAATVLESAVGLLKISVVGAKVNAAFCGGEFGLKINGEDKDWNRVHQLFGGDMVEVLPGAKGNYALIRLDHEFDVPSVIGSRATNTIAHLGGFEGRLIGAGDVIELKKSVKDSDLSHKEISLRAGGKRSGQPDSYQPLNSAIRFIWGMHADLFSSHLRHEFTRRKFIVSPMLNRMGVRLVDKSGVFKEPLDLSLVSDAIVPGDVQILGDGTPIVLMRDHQPTGGYPRIASVISVDLDRFAQLRPGAEVKFMPVTVARAHHLLQQAG